MLVTMAVTGCSSAKDYTSEQFANTLVVEFIIKHSIGPTMYDVFVSLTNQITANFRILS